ncbi:hypothetical protein P7K49_012268 [Saguinus oedipus]|uniref:Uncharacterized protein n=1 Tax=Saguinus oedipus TaxID=9490 RepID=A0ABQ9VTQ3_SAGOE|nr:hypothetical protein P7K49_012268 [Saguinus oedipus]
MVGGDTFVDIKAYCNSERISMLSYCDRYSEGMKRVLKTFGPIPEFSRATAEKVNQGMCLKVPDDPEHLAARRQWRDECLMRLAKLKSQVQPHPSAVVQASGLPVTLDHSPGPGGTVALGFSGCGFPATWAGPSSITQRKSSNVGTFQDATTGLPQQLPALQLPVPSFTQQGDAFLGARDVEVLGAVPLVRSLVEVVILAKPCTDSCITLVYSHSMCCAAVMCQASHRWPLPFRRTDAPEESRTGEPGQLPPLCALEGLKELAKEGAGVTGGVSQPFVGEKESVGKGWSVLEMRSCPL